MVHHYISCTIKWRTIKWRTIKWCTIKLCTSLKTHRIPRGSSPGRVRMDLQEQLKLDVRGPGGAPVPLQAGEVRTQLPGISNLKVITSHERYKKCLLDTI